MDFTTMDQWRAAASRLPGRKQGKRYPAAMRAAAVHLAATAEAAGMTPAQACEQLGIPGITLKAWSRARQLVPVEVVDGPGERVRLVFAGGHADVTVEQLAALLRRLP